MRKMNSFEEEADRCLQLLLEGKLSEAKVLVDALNVRRGDLKVNGTLAALEGIRLALGPRGSKVDLVKNVQDRFEGAVKKRKSSYWSDEFDSAFFAVWLKLIRRLREEGSQGNDKGVVGDPREQE